MNGKKAKILRKKSKEQPNSKKVYKQLKNSIRRILMEFNEKSFITIAMPRIKKFYEMNKEVFHARAMDMKDIAQEMRIELWQTLATYEQLADEEYAKLINKILSRRLSNERRSGYKHMKSEEMVIDDDGVEKTIMTHLPQFLDIDSINESKLIDTQSDKLRAKVLVDGLKQTLSKKERILIDKLFTEGYSEYELACQQVCCSNRSTCDINSNPDHHLSNKSNINYMSFKTNCKDFNKVHKQAVLINRLKNKLLIKLKKTQNKM